MSKKDEAREILSTLKMPPQQQSEICCYTLLAMCSVSEDSEWTSAMNAWIRIHDIIQFTDEKHGVRYAENSRETFRKQAIHHFRTAAIIEDNGKATNSPNYRYRLTGEFLQVLKTFGSDEWHSRITAFLENHPALIDIYSSKRKLTKMPVNINGVEMDLSTGKHNLLQKMILEEFAPRFAPYSECIYVGLCRRHR